MKRAAILLALALASGWAHAGISGEAAGCAIGGQSCTLKLRLAPDEVTRTGPVSLFVGIVQTVNGEPNPSVAGWYDGRTWVAGAPKAAWSGVMSAPRAASIAVPGGVCSMVGKAGGPAGTYTVYAGWGAKNVATLTGIDPTEIQAAMRGASPELAAKYAQILADYRGAQSRLAQYGDSPAIAFTNMRNAGSFWRIQSFNCGG